MVLSKTFSVTSVECSATFSQQAPAISAVALAFRGTACSASTSLTFLTCLFSRCSALAAALLALRRCLDVEGVEGDQEHVPVGHAG